MKFKRFEDITVGDKAEFERKITADDIDLFAKMTGDTNPLHVDEAFASRTPFKGCIAHGMLTASFISRLVGMFLPGPGALYLSQHCEFLSPVKAGDSVLFTAVVERKYKSANVISLRTKLFNQEGKLIINGLAKVMVMSDLSEDKYKNNGDNKHSEDILQDKVNIIDSDVFLSLKNKVVIVTGSGRGIGAEIAKLLSLSGASVVINYLKDNENARKVADDINKKGRGRAITVKADISKADEVKSMFAEVIEKFGDIDILVNNASSALDNKAFVSTNWNDFDRHMNTILKGAYNCSWEAIDGMKRKGGGKIINILSSVIYEPQKFMASYLTAKSALMGLSKSLACELAAFNITVNTVSPGMTETDLISGLSDYVKKTAGARLPLKRIAKPNDIAKVVLFLSTEGADYMTGVDIPVCGGEHI